MKSDTQNKLQEIARAAKKNAHAPYSNFPIGVAVLSANGNYYAGCNVENASYPEGLCGESAAIAAMVLGGDTEIQQICIIGPDDTLVPPCGGCRQRIREFSTADTRIHICNDHGHHKSYAIEELLPESFGPEFLKGQNS